MHNKNQQAVHVRQWEQLSPSLSLSSVALALSLSLSLLPPTLYLSDPKLHWLSHVVIQATGRQEV